MRRGIVASNPVANDAVRKAHNQRERFLSFEEIRRLGAAFDAVEAEGANPKALNIARLLALTSCRRNEIAGLRWLKVESENDFLRLSDSKTGWSIRPIGTAARALLAALKSMSEAERIAKTRAAGVTASSLHKNDSEWVFPAERGDSYYARIESLAEGDREVRVA